MFYIPGYDPVPPRRYRELYRKEGAEQAAISDYSLEMQTKSKDAKKLWLRRKCRNQQHKNAHPSGDLFWADIVQTSMNQNIAGTYLLMLRTALEYIGSGALFGLMKLRLGPVIAALYPVIMLLLQLLVATSLRILAFYLGKLYIHWTVGFAVGIAIF